MMFKLTESTLAYVALSSAIAGGLLTIIALQVLDDPSKRRRQSTERFEEDISNQTNSADFPGQKPSPTFESTHKDSVHSIVKAPQRVTRNTSRYSDQICEVVTCSSSSNEESSVPFDDFSEVALPYSHVSTEKRYIQNLAKETKDVINQGSELASSDTPTTESFSSTHPNLSSTQTRISIPSTLSSVDLDHTCSHLSRGRRHVDCGRIAAQITLSLESSSEDINVNGNIQSSSRHDDEERGQINAVFAISPRNKCDCVNMEQSLLVDNPLECNAEDRKSDGHSNSDSLTNTHSSPCDLYQCPSTCSQGSLDLNTIFSRNKSQSPSRDQKLLGRMSNETNESRNSVTHPATSHSIINFVEAVGVFNRRASMRNSNALSAPVINGASSASFANVLTGNASGDSVNYAVGTHEDHQSSRRFYESAWFDDSIELIADNDETDAADIDARRFSELVSCGIHTVEEAIRLLRRTRAVTLLANRLMLAEDEVTCFEIVNRLLNALFGVKSSSACLMIDRTHYTFVKCIAVKDDATGKTFFEFNESGRKLPIAGTAVEKCRDTLDVVYTPDTLNSSFSDHHRLAVAGMKTLLNAPILVGGRKFAGTLNMGKGKVDGFSEHDRILVKDIATTLGAHVFSKRLQIAERESHKVSQELLHSIIPEQVLSKIEHYWRDEDGFVRPLPRRGSGRGSMTMMMKAHECDSQDRFESIRGQLGKLKNLSRHDSHNDLMGALHRMEVTTTMGDKTPSRALFAEEKKHVSVIFTDIVGFSRISIDVPPLKVMDMLQDLFSRFDWLCEHHDVLKLETIGDAYLAAVGLFEEDNDRDNGRMAAVRALDMAKDMVREAQHVVAARKDDSLEPLEYLQIRVGIHVGDITYGVLGQHLPKLSVFGHGVNMAARMEQTSDPGKIHVTKDFKELVGNWELNWEDPRVVPVKNMGEVMTFLLDPSLDPKRNY